MWRTSPILLVVLLRALSVGSATAAPPRVVLVVIDGLGAARATPDHLPRLAGRLRDAGGVWTTATGVLPARTNPNHASLLTGYWPSGHGIVGNAFWDEEARRRRPMEAPELLDAETMFAAIERQAPALRTVAVFAKAKLRRLFGPGKGVAGPDVVWTNDEDYAADAVVMAAARALLVRDEPDLLVVSIADLDRASHGAGPGSQQARRALARADELVEGLVGQLMASPAWPRTAVVVTGDHGFASVDPERSVRLPDVSDGGVAWVAEGTVAWAYPTPSADGDALAAALRRAGRREGVAEVRTDLDGLGLAHPRAGAFLAMAAPGRAFRSGAGPARLRGDHGGAHEQRVPFLLLAGSAVRREGPAIPVHLPDFAPTAARLLSIDPPAIRARRDGARPRHGRVLPWVDGQTPQHSK